MKKKYLIALFILIVIAIVIFFGLKSCEPRTKTTDTTTPATETQTTTPADTTALSYRSAFINANIDFTCQLYKNPTLKTETDTAKLKKGVHQTYDKYGLPVANNEIMVSILKQYENDQEVITTIKENSLPCSEGKDPIFIK
ncbi:MAG: hypothetical protein WC806_00430 [Candidatus Gracilibacteria bacterium]|jgi:hypothetical protein